MNARAAQSSILGRWAIFVYGLLCYPIFLVAFLYSIGFVGNLVVPKSIDSGGTFQGATAILIDVLLLAGFALQHSVMARPAFKKWWTQFVPAAAERSTYVLLTSLWLLLLFWLWQPLTTSIWQIENAVVASFLHALFWLGWLLVLVSTFLIDHFELFGLKQVLCNLRGREIPSTSFKNPLLYRVVRHPIMLGFVIAFWATPSMTLGHLLFALLTTAYILIAIQIEERDLVAHLGEQYQAYQRSTSMLIPVPRIRSPRK
jgi:protein-S-isoprenylcysteine O-methyltransferase Ste14